MIRIGCSGWNYPSWRERFYPEGVPASRYSHTELRDWAARIRGWADRGIDVFAYFNNDWEGFAPRNALDLRRMVGGSD